MKLKKRTDKQIVTEISKLEQMKPRVRPRSGFGDSHHDAIDAQIEVLKGRLDNDAIYDRYWGDPESGDEMPEDVLIAALDAMGWMDGGSYGDGVKPSESWKELLVS